MKCAAVIIQLYLSAYMAVSETVSICWVMATGMSGSFQLPSCMSDYSYYCVQSYIAIHNIDN